MVHDNAKRTGLLTTPWWAHLVFAVLSYPLLRYAPPLFLPADGTASILATLTGQAAPIVAMLFFLLAAHGLYRDTPGQKENGPERDDED